MFETFKVLNLQLFDGAAAAPAAGGNAGGEASGANPQGDAAPAPGDNAQAAAVPETSTKPAVKTYTEDEVQTILKGRLEKSEAQKALLGKLGSVMELVGSKYGVDASDLTSLDVDALYKRIADDDSLYEEEAERRGMSVEATKQLVQLEKANAQMRKQQEEAKQDMLMQNHFRKVSEQAANTAKVYPGFDLMTEMKNPEFARLTSPNVGIDVKTAYEIVHHNEIQSQMAAHVAQQTAVKISNSIQAGSNRPKENGTTSQQTAELTNDPRTWSKEYRKNILEEVRRGKKLVF